jgi:hypothetical protein
MAPSTGLVSRWRPSRAAGNVTCLLDESLSIVQEADCPHA